MFRSWVAGLCCLSLVTGTAWPVRARDMDGVMIQAPQADPKRFEGFVRSRAGAIKYSDYYRQSHPALEHVRKLQDLFNSANASFLGGTLTKAKQDFEMVTLEAHAADWGISQRRLIHLSFLRLAQMAESPEIEAQVLAQAVAFDPSLNPPKGLIPPPLMARYRGLQSKTSKVLTAWDVSTFSDHFDYILVDGRTYDLKKGSKILLTNAQHRVTLLSDLYSPITRILMPDQILALIPAGIPMVQGTCQAPDLDQDVAMPENLTVMFAEDCLAQRQGGMWMAKPLSALAVGASRPTSASVAAPPVIQSKTNWLLIGVLAAVVGAVAYAIVKNNQPHQEDPGGPTPTHE